MYKPIWYTIPKGLTFHKIPSSKKPLLQQKWLHNIGRELPLPKDSSFHICSVHFDETCFKNNLQVSNFIISSKAKYIFMYYLCYISISQDIFSLFNFLSVFTNLSSCFQTKKSLFEAFIFVFTNDWKKFWFEAGGIVDKYL